MAQSENTNEIVGALSAAQGEFKPIRKTSSNPFFKSKYADLAEVRAAVTEALSKHKLAIVQAPEFREGSLVLVTKLMHASGQWIDSTFPLGTKAKIQEMGSEITYARRYCLSSILGVASEDDDDGNKASDRDSGTNGHHVEPPRKETLRKDPPPPPRFYYDISGLSEHKQDEAKIWLKGQTDVKPDPEQPGVWISPRRLAPLDKHEMKDPK